MSFGDQDLATFMAEGVPAVVGTNKPVNVLLEWPEDVDYLHSQMTPGVVVAKVNIRYVTGSLNLKKGMAINVDGALFAVTHTWKVEDGKFTKAGLNKA